MVNLQSLSLTVLLDNIVGYESCLRSYKSNDDAALERRGLCHDYSRMFYLGIDSMYVENIVEYCKDRMSRLECCLNIVESMPSLLERLIVEKCVSVLVGRFPCWLLTKRAILCTIEVLGLNEISDLLQLCEAEFGNKFVRQISNRIFNKFLSRQAVVSVVSQLSHYVRVGHALKLISICAPIDITMLSRWLCPCKVLSNRYVVERLLDKCPVLFVYMMPLILPVLEIESVNTIIAKCEDSKIYNLCESLRESGIFERSQKREVISRLIEKSSTNSVYSIIESVRDIPGDLLLCAIDKASAYCIPEICRFIKKEEIAPYLNILIEKCQPELVFEIDQYIYENSIAISDETARLILIKCDPCMIAELVCVDFSKWELFSLAIDRCAARLLLKLIQRARKNWKISVDHADLILLGLDRYIEVDSEM